MTPYIHRCIRHTYVIGVVAVTLSNIVGDAVVTATVGWLSIRRLAAQPSRHGRQIYARK